MGYFIRPIVHTEMKSQITILNTLKEYQENRDKPLNSGWLNKIINKSFIGIYVHKYKMEDLFFRGLGYIISGCNLEILNKYFTVYCKMGGDIYDRIYELNDRDNLEYEIVSRKSKSFKINMRYVKIKEESLDNMFNELYTSYLIKCKGWANEEEDFKMECKDQLRMFLNSGLKYWEYH